MINGVILKQRKSRDSENREYINIKTNPLDLINYHYLIIGLEISLGNQLA